MKVGEGQEAKRNNTERCRNFRGTQTDAEKKLWSILRNRQLTGVKFRRRFSVGKHIWDFYAPKYKLGIEADDGQHYEDSGKQRDKIRTRELSRLGVKTLRFSDLDILNNTEGAWEVIQRVLEQKEKHPPHLIPLPTGERRK